MTNNLVKCNHGDRNSKAQFQFCLSKMPKNIKIGGIGL